MKKVLSLLLAVMMVISLCPITALADEVNPIELQQVEAQEEQQEVAEPLAETAGEAVERTLSAGDFRINYKAAADGTVTEAGSNTYNAGTGKVYDVVLPYGAAVTSVTVADGSSYAQKLVYTAASSSAVAINDENVSAEDKYFKEAELLLADAVSSLVSSITWNESAFATDNMKGFVLEGRSFYPVKGSTIAFVRMPRTEQGGEQPEDPTKPTTGKNNGIFTVQLEDGTEIYPQELHGAATIDPDNDGTNYKMDYVDGFWRVIVPEGTTAIKISLDNLKNTAGEKAEPYAFFSKFCSMQYSIGDADSLQLDPIDVEKDGKAGFYGNISYEGSEEKIGNQFETKYENGFYTIPLEYLINDIYYVQDDAELYGYLDDFEGAKVNTDYKYASIFVGTFTKGKMLNGYDCQILVQIGGDGESGENTPPVRRSNVAASKLVSVDEKLQYTVDLSDVFYDADGDALTYKVRLGTDGEYVPFEGSTYTHTLTDWSGEIPFISPQTTVKPMAAAIL